MLLRNAESNIITLIFLIGANTFLPIEGKINQIFERSTSTEQPNTTLPSSTVEPTTTSTITTTTKQLTSTEEETTTPTTTTVEPTTTSTITTTTEQSTSTEEETTTPPTTTVEPTTTSTITTTTSSNDSCTNIINSIDSCDPLASCEFAGLGCKIYDPLDCHNYYLCINSSEGVVPSNNPVQCADNHYFNINTQNCELEINSCSQPCINYNCNYTCPEKNGEIITIADSHSCNAFYVCGLSENPTFFICNDPNPYFNGYNCTDNKYKCCSPCIPYCKIQYTETLDPFDCRSFYVCEKVGVPKEDDHFHCPDGESFNSEINKCQKMDTACKPLCSG